MGLTREQALECFASDDLIGIGMEADAVRRRLHPEGVVSYALNVYVHATGASVERVVAEALDRAATGVVLYGWQGGSEVEAMLRALSELAPELRLGLLESEVAVGLAGQGSLGEMLTRWQRCGLAWIEGDGVESSSVALHRAAHLAGVSTVASLCFGAGEGLEDRVAKLEEFRQLQEETGRVRAFTLRSAPAPTGRELDDPTAVEYLKTLAVCRMVLDNIGSVEANWEQQGLKVLQMALRFGADDAGSLFGRSAQASEEEVRRLVRDAGFLPVQRDSLSTAMFLL